MTTETKQLLPGLKPLKKDKRDFSHSKVFGSPLLSQLPSGDFLVNTPLEIKDQDINYPSDFCAAYAASEVSEDQEGVTFVPEFTFAMAKKLMYEAEADGVTPEDVIREFGMDLRMICLAGCKVGFLERMYDPFHCSTMERPSREELADWRNWPADLGQLSWERAKSSFFAVDGPYDRFDNYRSVMWQNRAESRSIITGCMWRHSWMTAERGIIPEEYEDGGVAHAFKIFGWKNIDGKMYLMAQLSSGQNVGDCGVFYFPRSVVNKEFVFGEFTFKDMPKSKAEYYNTNNITVSDPVLEKIIKVIFTSFIRLIKILLPWTAQH